MVELKTSDQTQIVTKTSNQIKDIEKEKGPKEPENKKERVETGELMVKCIFKVILLFEILKLVIDLV